MQIEWNKVTWYSKLGAVLVLIATIVLGFYLWNEYQEIQILNDAPLVDVSQSGSGRNIAFGTDGEEVCGPQPPVFCTSNTKLGCEVQEKRWDCFLAKEEKKDISTWKTYRNDEFGFEFNYPETWGVEEFQHNQQTQVNFYEIAFREEVNEFLEMCEKDPDSSSLCAGVGIYSSPSFRITLAENITEDDFNSLADHKDALRSEMVSFKNVSALRIKKKGLSGAGFEYYLFDPARSTILYATTGSEDEFSETKKVAEQILSTFRFVDTLTLQELLDTNIELNQLFQNAVTSQTGFTSVDFLRGDTMQISLGSLYPWNSDEIAYPMWVHSPDGTKAISTYLSLGEPDSSLDIYNRDGQKGVERLRSCGTPCGDSGALWLNDDQFVFLQSYEYYPPEGEIRCTVDTICTYVLGISLFDLKEHVEIQYISSEMSSRLQLTEHWSHWKERVEKIREEFDL